jgi:hypothetical protein
MYIKTTETSVSRGQGSSLANALDQSAEIGGTAARSSMPESLAGYGPATQVTLSGQRTAAARGNSTPDEDPLLSSIKFSKDLIKGENLFLEKLQNGEALISWKTKKPITDPLIIAKFIESSERIISSAHNFLNDLEVIAAGGNPSSQTSSSSPAAETLEPLSPSSAQEIKTTPADPILKPKETNTDLGIAARKAAASSSSGVFLLDMLTKGNEAYLAAARRKLAL